MKYRSYAFVLPSRGARIKFNDMLNVRKNFFLGVAAVIFLAVAIVHGFRAYYEWEAIIGGWMVPIWVSWLAALVGFIMALSAVKLMR